MLGPVLDFAIDSLTWGASRTLSWAITHPTATFIFGGWVYAIGPRLSAKYLYGLGRITFPATARAASYTTGFVYTELYVGSALQARLASTSAWLRSPAGKATGVIGAAAVLISVPIQMKYEKTLLEQGKITPRQMTYAGHWPTSQEQMIEEIGTGFPGRPMNTGGPGHNIW